MAQARGRCTHQQGSCVCTQAEYMQSVGITTFAHAYQRVPHFGANAVHYVPRDLMHVELEGIHALDPGPWTLDPWTPGPWTPGPLDPLAPGPNMQAT